MYAVHGVNLLTGGPALMFREAPVSDDLSEEREEAPRNSFLKD
jgi:hypothetical protein